MDCFLLCLRTGSLICLYRTTHRVVCGEVRLVLPRVGKELVLELDEQASLRLAQ
jgi:hypothetical protein